MCVRPWSNRSGTVSGWMMGCRCYSIGGTESRGLLLCGWRIGCGCTKSKRTAPGRWEPPLVVQIYYIKGLVLCQIVVLTSGRSAGTRSCVRGSQQIAICIRLSRTARISRDMCGTIAMDSIQAVLLPKSSMNAMGNI